MVTPGGRHVPGNRWDLVTDAASARTVSVIVTHFDQQPELDRTLAALARQQHPIEIIVADDGSPVPPVVPAGVRVVTQVDRGFRAAAARNLGAAAATGDVLCFLDADTSPEPGYVPALSRLPALLPEAVAVGRRRHADFRGLSVDHPVEIAGPAHELPEPAWLRDAYARSRNLLDADDRSYRYIISAVLACSRSFFAEVGGFDESFRTYGGEDWDFAHRAWQAGAVLAHVPDAVAWHDGPDWAGRDAPDRARRGNAQTLSLAARIPIDGSRGRALLTATPDTVVHVAGTHSPAATFVGVDSILAALPRAHVVLDEAPEGPLAHDPRVAAADGGIPDARVVVRLDRPVVVLDPGPLAERLRGLGTGEEGRLRIVDAGGALLATASARRARRRAERWGTDADFREGTLVLPGAHVLREQPDVEAWVGGWADAGRLTDPPAG